MQVLSEWMGDETICLGLMKQQVMSGRVGVQVRSERGGAVRGEPDVLHVLRDGGD